MVARVALNVAFLLCGSSAWAQASGGADIVPDLSVPPKSLGDERKFFLFHKAGVTAEQAENDLRFCWRYLAMGEQRKLPSFVAWGTDEAAPTAAVNSGQFGLIGVAIGGIVAGPLERRRRQSRMFRCMVPRGYARYRTSEALWKQLNTGDSERSIRLQARIAAGPTPPTPRVLP